MRLSFAHLAGLLALLCAAACRPQPTPTAAIPSLTAPLPASTATAPAAIASPTKPTGQPSAAVAPTALTNSPPATPKPTEPPHFLREMWFTSSGQLLVSSEAGLNLLDTADGSLVWSAAPKGCCGAVALVGDLLTAVAGQGNSIYVWDLAADQLLYQLEAGETPLSVLALSPDGRMLAAGALDQIWVWETATGRPLASWATGDKGLSSFPWTADLTNLAFTPGRQSLYSANKWSGQVMRWEPETGALQSTATFTNVISLAFSPDANQLVVEYNDYGFELHDPRTGTLLALHPEIISAPGSYTFSADGQHLAAWGYKTTHGHTAGVWDLANDTLLNEFHSGRSSAAAWIRAALNSDGTRLALSPESRNRIFVFDVATGQKLYEFPVP